MNKTDKKAQQWQQKQLKREYKLFVGEMKATNDSQGIVEGYLNAIGNIDYGKDRTLSGGFKRTLNNAYERKKTSGDDYLWPYLWNHDYNLIPPGGIFDADETKTGLFIKTQLNLDYQLGRDMYSSFKAKTLTKQSMGYVCHQWEYVKEDGEMIRNLIEVEVLEGSAVVFPMNNLADVTGVKRQHNGLYVPHYWPGFSEKSASGKTTWPLAPDSTKWDGGQATKDIEAWANGDWSKVAQCFFWVAKSPPEKLDDCKLPFVAKVGGKMQAVPQGIKSCAGVLQGAMGGVDLGGDEEAVKKKVAIYYKKMEMTPPWESDDSGKSRRKPMDKKDFNDEYRERRISLWLDGWYSLQAALKAAIMDAFDVGDQPMEDTLAALNGGDDSPGFIQALQDWIQEGIDLDYSNYLDEMQQSGNSSYYEYMSHRNPALAQKAGAAFSQDNTDAIHGHASALHDMADAQCKSMHNLANGLIGALQGLGAPSDPSYRQQGTTADDEKARRFTLARKASESDKQVIGQHATDLHDIADTIHQMAEDLAENTGATTYVDQSGDEDNAKETDKNKSNSRSRSALGQKHSPDHGTADVDSQDDVSHLFTSLQQLGSIL